MWNKLKIFIVILIIIMIFSVIKLNNFDYKIQDSIYKVKVYTDEGIKTGYGILYKVNEKGYIITNYHIISDANKIEVSNNVNTVEANIINSDPYSDISVISIDKKYASKVIKVNGKYKSLYTINNKDYMKIINLEYIEDSKVVIKLDSENFIIDCYKISGDITYGNSGGPLFNDKNEVVGIIFTKDEDYGYAIDINKALKIANKLESNIIKYPELNINFKDNDNNIIVTSNQRDIQTGDIINKIDDKPVRNIMELKYYLYQYKIGDKVKITFIRDNYEFEKNLILK